MRFFIATKNLGKLREIDRILKPMGIDAICERDLDKEFPDVEENGTTFKENALIKARAGCTFTGLVTVADDSGLCVDALDGAPGIYSARYSGEEKDTKKNNEKLLSELKDVPYEKRTAHFVSAIACVFPDGKEFCVEGYCEGHIGFEPRGEKGFGYDPLFESKLGFFGELSDEEKDSISHRGNSLKLFKRELERIL